MLCDSMWRQAYLPLHLICWTASTTDNSFLALWDSDVTGLLQILKWLRNFPGGYCDWMRWELGSAIDWTKVSSTRPPSLPFKALNVSSRVDSCRGSCRVSRGGESLSTHRKCQRPSVVCFMANGMPMLFEHNMVWFLLYEVLALATLCQTHTTTS